MRPSIHVRFNVKKLTSSLTAGSKAHCQELTEILYAETSLNKESRIPTVLRRDPRLFFRVFEQERKKKTTDAGAAPGTLRAVPDSAEGQGDGDDIVFVKVSVSENGVNLKTKSIPFCTSFQKMTANVKRAFSLPVATHFMLYYRDQSKDQILWFLFSLTEQALIGFWIIWWNMNRVQAGFQTMCLDGLFDWAF